LRIKHEILKPPRTGQGSASLWCEALIAQHQGTELVQGATYGDWVAEEFAGVPT
jgi:hypothetical protein